MHMQSDTQIDSREDKYTASNTTKYNNLHVQESFDKKILRLSILPEKFSVRRAKVILGRLKQNSCWQYLTISILFVLNSFMKNLLMTKSREDRPICDLFNGRASSP